MSDENTFDAIVVGSGITGGWAAKELTEKGLKTLVLEAGRNIVPEEDYVEHVPEWEMKFRGMGDRQKLAEEQPIQSTCYACDEWSSKFFIKDKEHPYSTDSGKPFRWIRGRQVGGRSITWGAISISRPTCAKESRSTGRSDTPTLRPGMTTLRNLPESQGRRSVFLNSPTANSCLRWN